MKRARQAKILELIRKEQIGTQEEMAARLQECGFSVTQATVSRDIRELELTKTQRGKGISAYSVPEILPREAAGKYSRVLKDAYNSAEAAMNLVVIKTVPGMAMAAAAALDEMSWPEIIGCTAGDNTILCVVHTPEEAKHVELRLREMMT